ncbi:MAG: mannose-6-phosphate isomerase, class I [Acidobacteria bacterium]|nr:mannose-6-phosphate isomerase, class I [Acidobacteriota bacterium]
MNTGLDRPLRLVPQVRHYDWGTRDFIPRLCGREPGDLPEAELWFGAHPDAPAGVVLESDPEATRASRPHRDSIPLNRLIAEHRVEVLGSGSTGTELSFLTKILSAARPLSIQAHPSREQAVRGFAAETGTRPVTSGDRNYRDPNPKPELLYALTPFSALSGFRPAAEATQLLSALGLERLRPSIHRLESEGTAGYRPLLEQLHRHTGTDLAAATVHAARRASTTDDPNCREAMRWVVRIAAHHSDDPLVIAPLFLRLIRLDPGEALFTGAGVPHSYLEGSAVEVMANSDNVLRLGLTSKHVDAAELLDILVYEAAEAPLIEPLVDEEPWGTQFRFQPPVDDFRLDVLHLVDEGEAPLGPDGRARIVLALEGAVEVRYTSGSKNLRPGQALFLPAAATAVTATRRGTLAMTTSNN